MLGNKQVHLAGGLARAGYQGTAESPCSVLWSSTADEEARQHNDPPVAALYPKFLKFYKLERAEKDGFYIRWDRILEISCSTA
jgi:hypothetical protein